MEGKIEIALLFGWGFMFLLILTLIFFSQFYKSKILRSEKEKQIIAFKAALEAEENQKEKIANNLHDEIITLLTALSHNIQFHKKESAGRFINYDKDLELIDQTIKGIKTISLDLIPTILLNFGLIKAIEQYIRQLNNRGRAAELQTNINELEELPFLKTDQVNIYRTCLEILNNLQKHAHYSYLRLSIEKSDTLLSFSFWHDGTRISNQQINALTLSSTGLGLKSLKSRLAILNAIINYSVDKNSAAITLTIPFNK